MVFKAIAAFILILAMVPASWAADPEVNGIFRLRTPMLAQGTCFAIDRVGDTVYFGTAFHVVENDSNGNRNMIFQGAVYEVENDIIKDLPKATVVATDAKADVAVIKLTTKRQFTILPLASVEDMEDVSKMGFGYRPSDKEVLCYGYASGNWMKTFGKLSFAANGKVYSDGVAVSGQSGGPAEMHGKIIGVISGGAEWYQAVEDPKKNVTWPTRLGSAKRLKEILDWAKKQK